ncbi:MAG TPA: hypothetical protein VNB89_08855 [Gemmatimonadaceae bacterium]|nr:hypothetical protein [Gemmatimonadaceae bacterium]
MVLRQGDAVRVVQLHEPAVQHLAVPNAQRVPRLGDVGTIVELQPLDGKTRYLVESDDGDGEIIWLAAFDEEEIRLEAEFETGR